VPGQIPSQAVGTVYVAVISTDHHLTQLGFEFGSI
jgi:hypothetical protein